MGPHGLENTGVDSKEKPIRLSGEFCEGGVFQQLLKGEGVSAFEYGNAIHYTGNLCRRLWGFACRDMRSDLTVIEYLRRRLGGHF